MTDLLSTRRFAAVVALHSRKAMLCPTKVESHALAGHDLRHDVDQVGRVEPGAGPRAPAPSSSRNCYFFGVMGVERLT